jgi:hypothetical protein
MSSRIAIRPHLRFPLALAALAALVGLLVVPTALGVVRANGQDFILPNGDIYQLDAKGQYHLIPDVATANAMRLNWNTLTITSGVGPVGAAYPSIVPAARTQVTPTVAMVPVKTKANGADYILPNGAVFQKDANGYFHWIPNTATATAMGINWNQLIRVNSIGLVGPAIPSAMLHVQPASCTKRVAPAVMANGQDYIVQPNPGIYQKDARGVYHLIPDRATANAMGVKWNQLRKVGYVAPTGQPYSTVCAG